ncbi:MAG: hypothetical protein SPG09_06220 [Lachnospiraceae bacterium]|nr:hypothetical protein [bacterium]MDY5517188.1 hypothetical protein [Lachnospiraceae bacterium]
MKTIRMKIIIGIAICSVLTAAIIGCVSVKNANDNARADAKEQLELNGSLAAQELNATISRVDQSVDTLSDMVLRELESGTVTFLCGGDHWDPAERCTEKEASGCR